MPGKIILTTCSLNHIAQAKSLGESVLKYAPGYSLVIGLVDKIAGRISPDYIAPHTLVEVEALAIPDFRDMHERYTTLELNCALKAFFTDYVLKKLQPGIFIFLDSDMLLFDSPAVLEKELALSPIILTPHILSPYPDDNRTPQEKNILKTGMFNAGFYVLRNGTTANTFVDWWKKRMIDQCYERPKEGLNVDQKWLNFVPFYFKDICVLRHPGCNVAYWNLHERRVEKRGDRFYVNNEPLVFYHFSGYSFDQPEKISRHQSRHAMEDNPAIKELFGIYHQSLARNQHAEMKRLTCYYQKKKGFWQRIGLKK